MNSASRQVPQTDETIRARRAKIARRVAAVAGAAGAAVSSEASATPLTYVPTAGVVAAKGIPGFSFTAPTTVSPGVLRPPASAGDTGWDVDGNGDADFQLVNGGIPLAVLNPLAPFSSNPNAMLANPNSIHPLANLSDGVNVGPSANLWYAASQAMTYNQGLRQTYFSLNQVGYFGFRFAFGNAPNEYFYGWASLTIDALSGGQGFFIGEAFYQSTPNTGINVGAVPQGGPAPVPELPGSVSPIALLAAGLFGFESRRARRNRSAEKAV